MKIARKYLAHFINTSTDEKAAVYERLGKDLEEFSPEMSAEVETKENILGETAVSISGYKKSVGVEPYYAEKGSALFDRLQAIIDGNLVLDALKTDVVDVKLWEGEEGATSCAAIKEEAYIEVTSYGGDKNGYRIAFNLHYTGVKTNGNFDLKSKTFTAAA